MCLKDVDGRANSVDPDQQSDLDPNQQSDLGLHCLPRTFCLKSKVSLLLFRDQWK